MKTGWAEKGENLVPLRCDIIVANIANSYGVTVPLAGGKGPMYWKGDN